MTRLLPEDFIPEKLNIEIAEVFPNCTRVFYLPTQAELNFLGKENETPDQNKKLIIEFNGQDGYVALYPIFTLLTHPKYLQQKYEGIQCITLLLDVRQAPYDKEEVVETLSSLPKGFIQDIRFGVGLVKDYRFIISAVEEQTPYSEMVIGNEETGNSQNGSFYLNWKDFDEMRRTCDRLTRRARLAAQLSKSTAVYNQLAYRLGNQQKPLPVSTDAISKMLQIKITDTDKHAAMKLVVEDRSTIKQTDPITLTKLKNDIELVSLELLISAFEKLLATQTKEDTWQRLFNENPFILSLAFGYPAVKISDQASVGGKKLSGDSDKITDYLIKNGVTNNLALIEIKKPSSALLNKSAYRGSVYCASTELTGSLTQVLDQCYQLQKNIALIKDNNKIFDIESYAVNCILVIGMMPSDDDKKKSFEMFRRNSKNVHIITFDELLF